MDVTATLRYPSMRDTSFVRVFVCVCVCMYDCVCVCLYLCLCVEVQVDVHLSVDKSMPTFSILPSVCQVIDHEATLVSN